MKRIAIYGAGGFGKETKLLLESINRARNEYEFRGFIDDQPSPKTNLALSGSYDCISIAIAAPLLRERVYEKCNHSYSYPRLISPDVFVDGSVRMGKGLILCSGVKLTVDIMLGDFVIINLNSTIGHDVSIGSFTSIMPSANISGNVSVGQGVFIGSGATILQGLTIGDGAVIGAGAVVTRDVPPHTTAIGVPAKWSQLQKD